MTSFLLEQIIHHRVHKSALLMCILSFMNLVHNIPLNPKKGAV
jgi:hypothetical protein